MAPDKGKNKGVDFETMLRRHLSRGGAPVSPCAGFDTDTASCYLEGALWSPSRTRYEAHLAGCPSCRQHLIGLARFSQLAMVSEASVSPVLSESKYWTFWKSTVIRRFKKPHGVLSWHWNLAAAGSTIVACAVLIAVLVSHIWRQASPVSQMVAKNAQFAAQQPTLADSVPSPSSVERFPNSVNAEQGVEVSRSQESQSMQASKAPVPPDRNRQFLGQLISPSINGDLSKNEATNKIDANVQRLSGLREGVVQAPQNISQNGFTRQSGPNNSQSGQQTLMLLPNNTSADRTKDMREDAKAKVPESELANSQSRSEGRESAKAAQEAADKATSFDSGIGLRITPPPEDNPIQSKKASGRARDNKTLASGASTGKQGWINRVMQKGLAPNRRPNAEEKPAGTNENDETEKFLIRYVRDKTFSYQRGFWVDHDYNPGVTMWKVTHITRGSKQFEDLLSKEPHLKEFFSLGKVILVWRDEIYRVSDVSDK